MDTRVKNPPAQEVEIIETGVASPGPAPKEVPAVSPKVDSYARGLRQSSLPIFNPLLKMARFFQNLKEEIDLEETKGPIAVGAGTVSAAEAIEPGRFEPEKNELYLQVVGDRSIEPLIREEALRLLVDHQKEVRFDLLVRALQTAVTDPDGNIQAIARVSLDRLTGKPKTIIA